MNINHHPSIEMLCEFATGRIDTGSSILIAAHLGMCSACQQHIRILNAVGGVFLNDAIPEVMSDDALAHVLARIDVMSEHETRNTTTQPHYDGKAQEIPPYLPQPARLHRLSRWQWIGPGIHRRSLELPEASGARVFLLKAAPGTRMPDHTHTGTELTLVLKGAFRHAGGRYGPGDFDEADDTVDHQPIVEAGEECVCLVAMQGSLALKGNLGRLLQPLISV